MATAQTYPHLTLPDDGTAPHLTRVPRVRVSQIVADYLAHGWSPDEMCRQHPYLRPAEAHAAMAYYFDHQADVERELQDEWSQSETDRAQAPRSRFYLRMKSQGRL